MNRTTCALLLISAAVAAGEASAATPALDDCGSLVNGYGPWDYTNAAHRRDRIPIVEQYHLDSGVRELRRGQSGDIISDLDYTLRAVPNHHVALDAMARYYRAGGDRLGHYSAACYFDRAIRFKPDDGVVRLIKAVHLHRTGDLHGARASYETALEMMPDSAEAAYNLGLLYLDVGEFDRAREMADRAYALGHPLPGLRKRLESLGRGQAPAEGESKRSSAVSRVDD